MRGFIRVFYGPWYTLIMKQCLPMHNDDGPDVLSISNGPHFVDDFKILELQPSKQETISKNNLRTNKMFLE